MVRSTMRTSAPDSIGRFLCTSGLIFLACFVRWSSQSGQVPGTRPQAEEDDKVAGNFIRSPYPGLDPQYQSLGFVPYLFRRDCLANGSNYCFGNSVDACMNCGVCCSASSKKWCCDDSTSTCCGSGCCPEGATCVDGECSSPVVTITSMTTIVSTVTDFATKLVSLVLQVDETSTVNSVVFVIISNVDIATAVAYTTTTIGLATETALSARANGPRATTRSSGRLSSLWRRLARREALETRDDGPISPFASRCDPVPWTDQQLSPAAEAMKVARAASTTTTILSITSTTHVTKTISSTATGLTTSVALVTSTQTETSVLNAEETVSITSTITRSSKPPVTQTLTSVTTILASATSETSAVRSRSSSSAPSSSQSSNNPGSSLPSSTIIGIGIGSGVGAITIVGILFVIWRVRRKRIAVINEPVFEPVPAMLTSSPPQQFIATPPAHREVDFGVFTRPPRGAANKSNRSSGQSTMLKMIQGQGGRDRSSTGTHSYAESSTVRGSTGTPYDMAGRIRRRGASWNNYYDLYSTQPERRELE